MSIFRSKSVFQKAIEIGDTVYLNSGGPPMNVLDIGRRDVDTATAWVSWQGENDQVWKTEFPVACLCHQIK